MNLVFARRLRAAIVATAIGLALAGAASAESVTFGTDWKAEAELGGLLASVGGRLVDGIASRYMKQITENIQLEVSK